MSLRAAPETRASPPAPLTQHSLHHYLQLLIHRFQLWSEERGDRLDLFFKTWICSYHTSNTYAEKNRGFFGGSFLFSQLIYYMFQCHKILSLTILSSPTTCMSRNVASRLNFQYSFGYITEKKNTDWKRYTNPCVYSYIIYNSQDKETT